MKLAQKCTVSLHTNSEEKLPLDNISLFLLFEIVRSYNLCNMTVLSGQSPEHRSTEGPTHRRVKTPKSHDTSYTSFRYYIILLSCHVILIYHITSVVSCPTDISYRTDTSYNTDISRLDIIYSHYNNTQSWHHISSCRYHVILIYCVVYHIILHHITSHHIIYDIWFMKYDIWYDMIYMIWYMTLCHVISYHIIYHTSYHIIYHIISYHISYWYFNCYCNIIRIYRSHSNNLRYQNKYFVGYLRLPLNWRFFLNLLLSWRFLTCCWV